MPVKSQFVKVSPKPTSHTSRTRQGASNKSSRRAAALESTAWHEASHVVLLHYFDLRFFYVSIKPNSVTISRGHVEYESLLHQFEEVDRPGAAEDSIIVLYAGREGERLFAPGVAPSGAEKDDRDALKLRGRYVVKAAAHWLRREARRLVKKLRRWIKRLAKELLVRREMTSAETVEVLTGMPTSNGKLGKPSE